MRATITSSLLMGAILSLVPPRHIILALVAVLFLSLIVVVASTLHPHHAEIALAGMSTLIAAVSLTPLNVIPLALACLAFLIALAPTWRWGLVWGVASATAYGVFVLIPIITTLPLWSSNAALPRTPLPRDPTLSPRVVGVIRPLWGQIPHHWLEYFPSPPPRHHWSINTSIEDPLMYAHYYSTYSAGIAALHHLHQSTVWAAFVPSTLGHDVQPLWYSWAGVVPGGTIFASSSSPRHLFAPPWLDTGPQQSSSPLSASTTDALPTPIITIHTNHPPSICTIQCISPHALGYATVSTTTIFHALMWTHAHLSWSLHVSPAPRGGETPEQFFSSWQGEGSCSWIASRVAYLLDGAHPGQWSPAQLAVGWWVPSDGIVRALDAHAWLVVYVHTSRQYTAVTVDPTEWVPTAPPSHASSHHQSSWLLPTTLATIPLSLVALATLTTPSSRRRALRRRLARRCRLAGIEPTGGACEMARVLGDEDAYAAARLLGERIWGQKKSGVVMDMRRKEKE